MTIKQKYDVHLIGRASGDATMETVNTQKGPRSVVKFKLWVGSGKNRKTDKYQTPFFFNVKSWGDSAKEIKKGQDVELFGYFTRNEYEKDGQPKTWDEVVVNTDEKGVAQINFAGLEYSGTKHVSDEAVSQGKGKVIQKRNIEAELEITDEDIPF